MSLLFVGAGKRLLLFHLRAVILPDSADTARRWRTSSKWARSTVGFASPEKAHKKFSAFHQPPWDYEVVRDSVVVNVMGKKTQRLFRDCFN